MKQTFNSKKKAVLITTHERSVMPRKKPKDQLSTTRPKRQQLSNNSAARVYYRLYLKHKWYNMFYFILKSCYLHFSFLLFPSFGFKCFFLRRTKWNVTYRSGNSAQREAGNYNETAFHFRCEFQNKSPNTNKGVYHYNWFSGENNGQPRDQASLFANNLHQRWPNKSCMQYLSQLASSVSYCHWL